MNIWRNADSRRKSAHTTQFDLPLTVEVVIGQATADQLLAAITHPPDLPLCFKALPEKLERF